MTLRVYFHIDDTDHDFVHARARQQRLYYIIALVYVTVLALDFFYPKKITNNQKVCYFTTKKIPHLLLQDGDHGKQGLFCFA